jgi:hypothetical protein
MVTLLITLLLSLLMPSDIPTQPQGWRGIVPLRSTRNDVRRVLGPPKVPNKGFYDLYDLKDETVYISYASGFCSSGWRVPSGTVISINIAPKTDLKLADLHLTNKYERQSNPHLSGIIFYVNKEDGITVEAIQEEVTKIYYYPIAVDSHLRCPEKPSRKSSTSPTPTKTPTPTRRASTATPTRRTTRSTSPTRRGWTRR